MPSCSQCGAERPAGAAAAGPCARCGAVPGLELDVPKRSPPRPAAPKKKVEEAETKLELAIDPRELYAPASAPRSPLSSSAASSSPAASSLGSPPPASGVTPRAEAPTAGSTALARVPAAPAVVVGSALSRDPVPVADVGFDAQLLAEYGDAPRHWLLTPFYAWRVLRRRRELRRVLVGRKAEAERAVHEAEDALVAFAERVRHTAEAHQEYAPRLEELRGAEDVLRGRDRVLASEQDAQTARLASVDARLAKLEAELAEAQAAERGLAGELASMQAALARGESKLKRAESELRAAQQREADGSQA